MISSKLVAPAVALVSCLGMVLAVQSADKPAVKIEVRKAETKAAEGLIEATVERTANKVYLQKEAVLVNKDFADVRVADGEQAVLEITFSDEGKKKIAKVTEDHQGNPS